MNDCYMEMEVGEERPSFFSAPSSPPDFFLLGDWLRFLAGMVRSIGCPGSFLVVFLLEGEGLEAFMLGLTRVPCLLTGELGSPFWFDSAYLSSSSLPSISGACSQMPEAMSKMQRSLSSLVSSRIPPKTNILPPATTAV